MNADKLIHQELMNALKKAELPTDLSFVVEIPKDTSKGDYATNVAMQLTKIVHQNPREIAQKIVQYFDANQAKVTKVEIAGPGFLNFFIKHDFYEEMIEKILKLGFLYGHSDYGKNKKYNIEFVSANPTGDLHLGHARQAALGDSICRLLKAIGYQVTKEYYLNDGGNQINNLAQSLFARYQQALGLNVDFPEDGYHGQDIIDIANDLKNQYQDTLLNQSLDYFKEIGIKKEMDKIIQILDVFRVHFDVFTSEKMLYQKGWVDEVIPYLTSKGFTYELDGAIWFKTTLFGDDKDRVLKKSDGSYTYLVPDIAYHKYKLERGFDYLVNILGADHHGYVARVKASIEALGYDPNKLEVLLGQLVNLVINGEEVRMGKRKNMVTLDDLIEEVGIDATRYWMEMRNIDMTLDFDIELAKKSTDENPVFYVQYAYARVCSILRNAVNDRVNPETGESVKAPMTQAELDDLINNFDKNIILKTADSAKALILKLEEFKSVIKLSAENRTVYTICRYVQELAAEFHSFYNSNRVICDDKDLMKSRLALMIAIKTTLKNALDILAVSAPERM